MKASRKKTQISEEMFKGMLYKRNMLDDPLTTSEYLEIIHDYMIGDRELTKILNRASNNKKRHPDFDYYRFIVYSLIKLGKEGKSILEKENK